MSLLTEGDPQAVSCSKGFPCREGRGPAKGRWLDLEWRGVPRCPATPLCVGTHTHMHTHAHTCTRAHTYLHTCMHTHAHAHTYMYMHAHTYVHAYAHARTHTLTHGVGRAGSGLLDWPQLTLANLSLRSAPVRRHFLRLHVDPLVSGQVRAGRPTARELLGKLLGRPCDGFAPTSSPALQALPRAPDSPAGLTQSPGGASLL